MVLADVRTIDDMGRIVVPKDVRSALGWEKGTKIAIYICDGVVMLRESTPGEVLECECRGGEGHIPC
ncbi:MAG: AbrB/MazE/SpoVT family DNA-binding domain-containing protein [Defluviitaleaceae bacterium]|nr:AbrB/MazE/SpoVT family DNA-binding domain-containing protein [Defluviitaleaceae bacterium]